MKSLALRCASILPCVLAVPAAAAATPEYIKADRAVVEKKFGAVIAGNIFSDRLTASRKQFVARALKRNPVSGCAAGTAFTIAAITPLKADQEGTIWEERYEIACSPAVFRSALFNANVKTGQMQVSPGVPGASLASSALRKEFVPKLLESAATPGCAVKKISIVDAAPLSKPEKDGAPWTELWKLKACGALKEIEVALTPGEGEGAATTWQFTPK